MPLGALRTIPRAEVVERGLVMGHNEYIVYEAARHKLKYVLHCTV